MFMAPEQYSAALKQMVLEESSLDVAVAFWGNGAELHVHPDEARPIRIICNLMSGGTNPWVIKGFLKRAENNVLVQVRQCDRLHAKVLVGPGQAIIGSANISANGLGLAGSETAHWIEAGVHTTAIDEVAGAQSWFDQLWNSTNTRTITPDDLARAIVAYKRHRDTRPDYSAPCPFSFTKLTPADLADRDAYALLYVRGPSEDAKAATARHSAVEAQTLGATPGKGTGTERWPFECWPEDLDTSTQIEYLAMLWNEEKSVVEIDGPCVMTATQLEFTYSVGGEPGWLDLARPTSTLIGHSLAKKQCRALAKELNPRMRTVWDEAEILDEGMRRIHLRHIAEILQR
ncbi:phospholipase D family protein (plasmid) [Pseudomonas cannabina pv. alisalensis]|uniref:Phospholipase D-like domain-containing protein n=1 Tax=Pseudomonas syringae pv. maculicola str. ES4326 TaxID=629265 RepID=A0A8T8CBA1_PSEYM|nr:MULTISPECIES: phospholipase D family protein [Pseudomonas syringae group]QHF00548.1 hypothetical protein PMA4326_028985 [Pseudomonas syringae pv. maculicola str. ES4326]UBZ00530.1 phospholipase D family protein [Pseudomonas cannabina pv. alisalensis]